MNIELILSISAIVITVFSLIIFNFYSSMKKYFIKKSFGLIAKFYDLYAILNPFILQLPNGQNILTEELIRQNFFNYGFPRFKFVLNYKTQEFNPFFFE